jgi:hypothetical protein
MDRELHNARIGRQREKITHQRQLSSLPDGCFVHHDGSSYLVWHSGLLLWSPERYLKNCHWPRDLTVTVLTPEPIVRCLSHGYKPEIHASALEL